MPDERAVEEQVRVFARQCVKTSTAFHPVVALVAKYEVSPSATEHEVIILTGKDFTGILTKDNVVTALIAEQQVRATGTGNHVVALVAAENVVAKRIFDDVVAFAAEHVVGLRHAVKVVVAAIAPQGVHAAVAKDPVNAFGTAQHIVLAALHSQGAADIVRTIGNGAAGVGPYDFGTEDRLVKWIAAVPNGVIPWGRTIIVGLCNATIEFNDVVRRNE